MSSLAERLQSKIDLLEGDKTHKEDNVRYERQCQFCDKIFQFLVRKSDRRPQSAGDIVENKVNQELKLHMINEHLNDDALPRYNPITKPEDARLLYRAMHNEKIGLSGEREERCEDMLQKLNQIIVTYERDQRN